MLQMWKKIVGGDGRGQSLPKLAQVFSNPLDTLEKIGVSIGECVAKIRLLTCRDFAKKNCRRRWAWPIFTRFGTGTQCSSIHYEKNWHSNWSICCGDMDKYILASY